MHWLPSEPASPHRIAHPLSPVLRALAICFVLALLVRAAARALPGWRAGIDAWIARLDVLSGALTHVFVLAGIAVVLRLVSLLARPTKEMHLGTRVTAIAAAVVVVLLAMIAVQFRLGILPTLFLAGATVLVSMLSCARLVALRVPHAASFALCLLTAAALLHLLGRMALVTEADTGRLIWYGYARVLATAKLAFGALGLVLFFLYVFVTPREHRRARVPLALAAVLGLTLLSVHGAVNGMKLDAASWQVLLTRMTPSVLAKPAPLVPAVLYLGIEVAALLTAALAVTMRDHALPLAAALALALAARASADVPVCALALCVAALAALVANLQVPNAVRSSVDGADDSRNVDENQVGHRHEEQTSRPGRALSPSQAE